MEVLKEVAPGISRAAMMFNPKTSPQTGYYRMMVWDIALTYIAQSPVIGYGYQFNDFILDNTVDSIWLVLSLRFGVPMIVCSF